MSEFFDNGYAKRGIKKSKPMRILYSQLSGRFYATDKYNEKDGIITVTGKKHDVTNDIGFLINHYGITFNVEKSK